MNHNLFFTLYTLTSHTGSFDSVIYFIANVFPYIVLVAAAIYLACAYDLCSFPQTMKVFQKNSKKAIIVAIPVALAWGISFILKKIIHAPRPFVEFTNVHPLFIESGYAFPSSHATVFAGLAVALFFVNKKVGYLFAVFALFIGVTRIISGVHSPVDILGGYILGAGVTIIFNLCFTARKR